MRIDVRQSSRKVEFDRVELCCELGVGAADLMQLDLDAGGRQLAVSGKVDEVLFFHRKLAKLALKLLPQQLLGAGLVGDSGFEALSHSGDELAAETDGLVVRLDGALDPLHVGVRCIAGVILDAPAEEVGVLAAVSTGGSHDDHAFDDPVFETAPSAPDGALQVVVVLDAPLAGLVPGVEQRLNFLEQFGIDRRLVTPVVRFTLVLDLAEVVTVPEKSLHLGNDDRCGRARGGGP
ncbi:hypothetical protein [Microbacterium sp. SORGH_AS_0421]|uniref:hypothetical protein n=1 Tax=Microbacterium sp. SORGH_AS_0421 TaxID=3041768 RepID=UPI002790F094|nr:hypothetical protein [Microbacterium sp. SORGH_AS_0421]MDQ1176322.1 hypothetical protein [Microbacterium sp. SORGH_AS_0421]